jgi:glycosyltransferase involved in cell wall biosynthesis
MTTGTPVSAVIPVYNGETYVAEAIRSALSQTRPPIECLVIDDGSTDATPQVVRQFGDQVVYVRRDRAGVSAARNLGAERARGSLVAFLDHDDVWLPTKLERQLELLADPHATLALCAVDVVDQRGSVQRIQRLRAREDLLTGMLMFDGTETVSCSSTALVRRGRFLRMGGFDANLSVSADWDLLFRMLLAGGVVYVDEPLVRYRVHDTNMSRDIGTMERDMTYAFGKAYLDPRLPSGLRAQKRRAYGRLYRMLGGSYLGRGERSAGIRMLALAVRYDPRIALELTRRGRGLTRSGAAAQRSGP